MKRLVKAAIAALRPVVMLVLSMFFERRYLTGRHFTSSYAGYVWAARAIWSRNILRLGPTYPWPVALGTHIADPKNLEFHPDDLNNFQAPGAYFQNFNARIVVGEGSFVAPNVGFITANHRLDKLDKHEPGSDIVIGKACWLGMNSVILPGVRLGDRTIVGAGTVVTRSFEAGGVVLGGCPARILKTLPVAAGGDPQHVDDKSGAT